MVKNYTGDRLNFGLAAEKARALGLKVEMVVVDDDVALPDVVQARGVAGTLFVHKIAGDAAERGESLESVAAVARAVIASVASIGMSLDTCTVPGVPKAERITPGMAELGLGIHGEPGAEIVAFSGAAEAMRLVLSRLARHVDTAKPHALLLNNLGGCTPLEMAVLAEEIAHSDLASAVTLLIGPDALMTSLDMHGFSVSVLALGQAWEQALRAPVAPRAWPGTRALSAPAVVALPSGLQVPARPASDDPALRRLVERCCDLLEAEEAALNAFDAKIGDGDTGSTLAAAARALRGALDTLPLADHAALFHSTSDLLGRAIGGSSGVLLAIFFAAAGDARAAGVGWAEALKSGLARIQDVGGAVPGDRTMIDALGPALDALADGAGIGAAARAARTGADATRAMAIARAGRAAYVSADTLRDVPDPGAEAVARLLEGLV